jgi:carboxyl-terminal processing protease
MIPELESPAPPAQDVAAATAETAAPDTLEPTPETLEPPPAAAVPRARAGIRANLGVLVGALGIVAVLAGSALFVAGFSLGRDSALTPGTPSGAADAFQPFWDTYSAITDRYAGGAVDQKSLVEGAIKGMIGALDDPYSLYMTSDEFKASLQGIAGQFEGIGATIGTVDGRGETTTCTTLGDGCRLEVVRPLTGSPAEKAGLRPGDVITAIDGTPLAGLTADAARSKVRGPKDTTVTLQIERGKDAAFEVPIVRAVIVQPEVETMTLADGKAAYIKLNGFSDRAAADFDAAVSGAVERGEKQIVVDLRGNPGGLVTAARDVASQFLPDGTIFWEEDSSGNLTETTAKPGGAATDPSIHVAVLVDGGSASASEIVTGALHDRGRAIVVGSKTFGKGTVQQWTQLEDDSGGFRLTIAKWLTPDKTWVHGVGITPDIVVAESAATQADDPVIDAALKALGDNATGSAPVLALRPAA